MSNVVSLRDAQYVRASGAMRSPGTFDTDISELVSRVRCLRSKVREEICQSIFMLNRAAQHARQIAKQALDPVVKENFNTHIMIIEQLLQSARNIALEL